MEWNFNSRPHRGRHNVHVFSVAHCIISTHALTEGDRSQCVAETAINISTHALTEGDVSPTAELTSAGYFNSRPHRGRRRNIPPENRID